MKNIIPIEQFLFESKSSAKKRFLDRGLISDEVFNHFLEIDTTPTKKFIEKMCEFFVSGSTEEEVIQTFQKATQSNVKFDISLIKSLSELQEILSQEGLTGSRDKVQIPPNESGVEITYEDNRCTIFYVTSKESAIRLGSGTTWCISAKKKNQWDNYKTNGSEFYFIYDYKTTNKAWKKLAIEINSLDPSFSRPTITVYNTYDNAKDYNGWQNDIVKFDYVLNDLKIPLSAFKYHFQNENDLLKYLYGIIGDITVNSNGELDVNGDVNISYKYLTEIPVKFGKVTGNFNCQGNNLTTLKNAPNWVGGSFDCCHNNLTSLEFAPSYVGGSFYCYKNNLTSLEFAPSEVGKNFSCYNNQITSLQGCPKKINGELDISYNNLENLRYVPIYIGDDFVGMYNNLKQLDWFPKTIIGIVDLRKQKSGYIFNKFEIQQKCKVGGRIDV